jgi:type IV secretion system protein VirB2
MTVWNRLGNRVAVGLALAAAVLPAPVWAQASPFEAGTTSLQTSLLTILTPVAVIAVMVLGVAAWFNRISWSWVVGGIAGIVLVFGSGQVVDWVRGMFGV